jgi:hypothetical protein
MEKIVNYGRLLFAVAIAAFGIQDLICARLGLAVRGIPWFPQDQFSEHLTGVALLAAGLSIAFNIRARLTAVLLGVLFLLSVLLFETPLVAAQPLSVGRADSFL